MIFNSALQICTLPTISLRGTRLNISSITVQHCRVWVTYVAMFCQSFLKSYITSYVVVLHGGKLQLHCCPLQNLCIPNGYSKVLRIVTSNHLATTYWANIACHIYVRMWEERRAGLEWYAMISDGWSLEADYSSFCKTTLTTDNEGIMDCCLLKLLTNTHQLITYTAY